MNWHYLKFSYQCNISRICFWSFVLLLTCFIPKEILGETGKDIPLIIYFIFGIYHFSKGSMIDLLSPNPQPGKATSMKYLLSLNMSKKELYINYLVSYYMLSIPAMLAFTFAALEFFKEHNIYSVIAKSLYFSLSICFMIASTIFHKKFFIYKAGSFQDQFLQGQKAYYLRNALAIIVSILTIVTFLEHFGIVNFGHSLVVIVAYGLALLFYIPVIWQLYVPLFALMVFAHYKKSLKDFNNKNFFHRTFRDMKRESYICVPLAVVLLTLLSIEAPPADFLGNKLTKAIYQKDFAEIKIVATKENLNKLSTTGVSPLLAAAYTGQWETYHYLKNKGASIYSDALINRKQHNLLTASIAGGNLKIIEDVLSLNEFDLNVPDARGMTSLHYVAQNCRGDIARMLISKRAAVNIQSTAGKTPLHLAIKNSCNDLGLVLLSLGADPLIKDSENKVAIDYSHTQKILPFLEEQMRKPASISEEAD